MTGGWSIKGGYVAKHDGSITLVQSGSVNDSHFRMISIRNVGNTYREHIQMVILQSGE